MVSYSADNFFWTKSSFLFALCSHVQVSTWDMNSFSELTLQGFSKSYVYVTGLDFQVHFQILQLMQENHAPKNKFIGTFWSVFQQLQD